MMCHETRRSFILRAPKEVWDSQMTIPVIKDGPVDVLKPTSVAFREFKELMTT